jgi:hypothetical protein
LLGERDDEDDSWSRSRLHLPARRLKKVCREAASGWGCVELRRSAQRWWRVMGIRGMRKKAVLT